MSIYHCDPWKSTNIMRNKLLLVFFLLFIGTKINAQVVVTSSDSIDCTNTCTVLTATLTGDNPTDAGIDADDVYPALPLPIGFNFNYYGTVYTQCVIGPNGTINFNAADAGAYADYTISATLAADPTLLNSIAGPYCDIDITLGGIITYSLTGTAPYRKYIVTFCNDGMFSCITPLTSTQIILYETTNIIEVHIAQKGICPWNGGYAIIGVKNATGTASTAAPGRDFPSVYTCANESWRFTPDATFGTYACASIPYAPIPFASSAIHWYNNTTGAYLGTGLTQTVCPTTTTTYKAGGLGCADTSFGYYTVVPSGSISPTYTTSPVITCGGNQGAINIGGMTPGSTITITYTFNGVPQPPVVAVASVGGVVSLTGLYAGTYVVTISNGTCSSSPYTVTLPPPPITITAVPHNPTVCGYANGYIVLSGYTSATGYTIAYTKDGVPIVGSAYTSDAAGNITINGLSAGSYTNITSTGGPCPPTTVAGPVVINNPAPPVVTVDSIYVKTCVGVPTQLGAYHTPSTVTEFYSWSPATDLSNASVSNPVVTPSAVGNVVYVVTGNPSPAVPACAYTATVTVHAIGDFSITTPTANICFLSPLVSVPVTVSGSTEISYAWTPTTGVVTATSQNPVITPTAPGTYVYTATGSYANCPNYVHTFTINVDVPPTPIIVPDTICLGMSDVVDFSASGGPGYHYLWTSSPAGVTFSNDTIPNPTFTPTVFGTFTLTATVSSPSNAAGCNAVNEVRLVVLPNTLTISPTDTAICAGQVVQVNGTLVTYASLFGYQWIPTTGIANPTVLNALIATDTSALYTVTASFHNCPDIYATLNLQVQPNPSVYLGGNRVFCEFDTLHLHASISPAWFSGYTYTWSPAYTLDMATGQNVVFTNDSTTTVHVVVTSSAGCTAEDSATFTLSPGNFAATVVDADFCPHDSRVIPITPAGYSYQWYPSMYVSDATSSSPTVSPITTQTYSIVGTSPDGCKDTVYWTATVHPDAVIEVGDSLTLYPGESHHIISSTNCSSFTWFPYAGLSNPLVSDPTATPDVSTMYIVTATTEHNCVAKDTLNIYVSEESLLAMPNAFTPGNGANNTFKVILRGIASLNYFRVYNRWGNLMFETKSLSEGWDGSYKGEPQAMDVFTYDVQAVSSTGKVFRKMGNVTLLR